MALNVICWPSLKLCDETVQTPGLATVILDTAVASVVEILCTKPVAVEVPPVTFSPAVNYWLVVILRWVNISISNR